MSKDFIPDFNGWEVYCEACKAFHPPQLLHAETAGDGPLFCQMLCTRCGRMLIAFQQRH